MISIKFGGGGLKGRAIVMDKCNLPGDGMSSVLHEFHLHFIWEFSPTSKNLVSRQTLVASSCHASP